ncbi:MAG: hypothetical protein A2020_14330 [Lentisphaerae bacterium GWF2_45_14]|nr:MAG: hypothetical protein A2020_14330 [Lentisphaerae bacterium GWF2_45_14]
MKRIVRNLILAAGIPIAIIIGFFLLPILFIFMIIILLISGGTIYKISTAKTKYRNMDDNKEDDAVDIEYEVLDEEKKTIEK